MSQAELERFIFGVDKLRSETRHPEITAPILRFRNPGEVGSHSLVLSFEAITEPFVMEPQPMVHEFDQVLIFIGGNPTNMLDLGGEVQLSLGKDRNSMVQFTFTTPTVVYIPAGMWHCPLAFTRIDDPRQPIFFQDLFFSGQYGRKLAEEG
ncbi:MAG: hypothetical protein ACPLPT_07985 [Moorellales bacterium]